MAMTAEQAKEVRLPTVCCILLTRDRPAMTARAVASFRAQTYERKWLLIYDTGQDRIHADLSDLIGIGPADDESIIIRESNAIDHHDVPKVIGYLRNRAIINAKDCDVIAHWDSDDWSHPNRLAEQVALLQSSGADCVGYNKMLFWDTTPVKHEQRGNAWLYRYPNPSYALGTSLCYWRRTWEAHPFDAINHGEDQRFIAKARTIGVSSINPISGPQPPNWFGLLTQEQQQGEPRMIASIHGGNSSPFDPAKSPAMCTRVPKWDGYCAERMALEVRA